VLFTSGEAEVDVRAITNVNSKGKNVIARPRWDEWTAEITIRIDADTIDPESALSLLARAGCFVGVGEGRPASSKSCGMGFGLFSVE
jgi:hypothetical protein